MMNPEPTIGRIVHFVTKAGAIRPAIIVDVHELLCVDLTIFLKPGEQFGESEYQHAVPLSPAKRPGTWHWPPLKTGTTDFTDNTDRGTPHPCPSAPSAVKNS